MLHPECVCQCERYLEFTGSNVWKNVYMRDAPSPKNDGSVGLVMIA